MKYSTQNDLLLNNLVQYYSDNNFKNLNTMLSIINGDSKISLRIVDWFSTNYAKHYFTTYVYNGYHGQVRFKVYNDYKLKLKAYQKRRFDPFCRWERISIPYKDGKYVQTTIGQLNFFKWALDNKVIDYIENNYKLIEADMNKRNSTSKVKLSTKLNTTRKKRQELSISAVKSVKKEDVEITISFD